MQLRIFEPRYIRMVKESLANDTGFGLCMLNPHGSVEQNEHIFPFGTHAKIVDFETLRDGLLGITITGGDLFEIKTLSSAKDGLRTGSVEWLAPWPDNIATEAKEPLTSRLQEVFKTYPELAELYPEKHYDDARWLCGRWLELLPLEPETKQELIRSQCPKKISQYICNLFE